MPTHSQTPQIADTDVTARLAQLERENRELRLALVAIGGIVDTFIAAADAGE